MIAVFFIVSLFFTFVFYSEVILTFKYFNTKAHKGTFCKKNKTTRTFPPCTKVLDKSTINLEIIPQFIDSQTKLQDKELSDRNSKLHSLQIENGLSMTFITGKKSIFRSHTAL